ncbi:MAG TPA: delta-60 repeat domain-containing protein, partial [Verrucomicrobiota bacterium]|nr:delta-60 repeat domain-containing protein [Verrucomicrobiota bacterium]
TSTNSVPQGANALVSTIGILPGDKIAIGGSFSTINNTNRNRVAIINPDGSLYPYFTPPTNLNAAVYSLSPQLDGRLLIGGSFSLPVSGIGRLRVNGSIDPSFDTGGGANGNVLAISSFTNGDVIIGGDFTVVGGVSKPRLAKLNSNGVIDWAFNPIIEGGSVYATAIQQDGKIIVGGSFTNVNGVPCSYCARLNSDGSLDTGFAGNSAPDGAVYSIAIQSNGKVLLGGSFTKIGSIQRNRIARLLADGSIDPVFDPGLGPDDVVYSIAITPTGGIVIGGDFKQVNGFDCRGVAMLYGDPPPPTFSAVSVLPDKSVRIELTVSPGYIYALDASTNLINWTPILTNSASGSALIYTDTSASGKDFRFFRARQVEK